MYPYPRCNIQIIAIEFQAITYPNKELVMNTRGMCCADIETYNIKAQYV